MNKVCRLVFCTVAAFCPLFALSQKLDIDKIADTTAVWCAGNITLANGDQLTGSVKFDKMTGLLQFENSVESKSLTPAAVIGFGFFDSLQRKQRKFISYAFDYMTPRIDSIAKAKGIPRVKINAKFFEVLLEFPDFAVLYSIGPISVSRQNGSIGRFNPVLGIWDLSSARSPSTTYMQTEMIYIFDKDGNVSPLLISMRRETDRWLLDKNNTMSFGKPASKIIQKYTEPLFEKVNTYAQENKLNYEKKDDMLKILEYYKSLVLN